MIIEPIPLNLNHLHRILVFDAGEHVPGSLFFLREMERIAIAMTQGYPHHAPQATSGHQTAAQETTHLPRLLSFLDSTNVLAGAGLGAASAVYLAVMREDFPAWPPLKRIRHCIDFFTRLAEALTISNRSLVKFATGLLPLRHGHALEKILEEAFGKNRTFDHLSPGNRVGVVALNVRGAARIQVFHNFGRNNTGTVRLVDAVARSLAFPGYLPIRQGHIAGSMVATNPSVTILTALIKSLVSSSALPDDDTYTQEVIQLLHNIRLVSLGLWADAVMNQQDLDAPLQREQTNWGFIQWMLSPVQPLVLTDASVLAGAMGNVTYSRFLLNESRFFRLGYRLPAPDPARGSVWQTVLHRMIRGQESYLRKVLQAESFVLDWLEGHHTRQFNSGVTCTAADVRSWLTSYDWVKQPSTSTQHRGEPA